jgi:prolyl-tRNA synthetase
MRQSKLFFKTQKIAPKEAEIISHKLLTRADFISQLSSGIYSFLPLGWMVHRKIENIIREEMERIGGQEVFLPTVQPKSIWQETGRWKTFEPPLFKLKDIHQKEFALGPTHEEVITDLIRKRTKSYKDLPFYLFQIQNKFRNEMRPSGGLLRLREFVMKDLYSFHASEKDLVQYYKKVKEAYFRIFKRCSLGAICVQADPGAIGGKLSHEFLVLAETGEDRVLVCKKCGRKIKLELAKNKNKCEKCKGKLEKKNCIEAAHAFCLGTKYSEAMGANFVDKDGKIKPIVMGCYGMGLGRLMAAIVEIHRDERGIIWPKEVAPFQIHLIQIENNKKVKEASKKIFNDLKRAGLEVLYDDREDKTAGEKFAEADLIGIPLRMVVSEKTLAEKSVEVKKRSEGKTKLIKINEIKNYARYTK